MAIGVRGDLGAPGVHCMGPLCGQMSFERYLRFQSIAARECAEVLRWGKPIDNPKGGYFVSPGLHLMSLEQAKTSVYVTNAFFGPDLAVVPVDSLGDALSFLGVDPGRRVVSVFSSSLDVFQGMAGSCSVPAVLLNTPTTTLRPDTASRGMGRAGNGVANGLPVLGEVVYPRTVGGPWIPA